MYRNSSNPRILLIRNNNNKLADTEIIGDNNDWTNPDGSLHKPIYCKSNIKSDSLGSQLRLKIKFEHVSSDAKKWKRNNRLFTKNIQKMRIIDDDDSSTDDNSTTDSFIDDNSDCNYPFHNLNYSCDNSNNSNSCDEATSNSNTNNSNSCDNSSCDETISLIESIPDPIVITDSDYKLS